MTYPPTIIGKFTPHPPEPDPPKCETLADVSEGVGVRTEEGHVMCRFGDTSVYVHTGIRGEEFSESVHTPTAWMVAEVLGPITAIQFGGEVQDG